MYREPLIGYLPDVIQRILDYQKLTDAEQPEIDTLWTSAEHALQDQFIADATENGISRWEKLLRIVPKATESLQNRRFTILARINEQLPYTLAALDHQLRLLCGEGNFTIRLVHREYRLFVQVGLAAKSNYEDVRIMLLQVVPANMVVELSLKYNQHSLLHTYTHGQLGTWTHETIRNEVLD